MKKKISLLLTVILVCTVLFGCSNREKSLYDQGIEIASLMSEMAANPEYTMALTGNSEVLESLQGAAAEDPRSPMAVYEISIREEALLGLLGVESTEGLSEPLKANLTAKSFAAIGPQINAGSGVNQLAAASMCTASLSFLNSGFTGNTIYLYTYKDSAPVLISFSAGQDGIVTATGCFLLGEFVSMESLKSVFAEFGAEIQEVKK